jgi:hypothetical protein
MTALRQLRLVAFLEGSSFLALLFIAMPLKYLAGLPLAVRIAPSSVAAVQRSAGALRDLHLRSLAAARDRGGRSTAARPAAD